MGPSSRAYLVAAALVALTGCAGSAKRPMNPAPSGQETASPDPVSRGAAPSPAAQSVPPQPAPVIVDQASVVIREAKERYLQGEEAYRAGDLAAARAHFDAALLAFMTSGLPVASDPRLREAYERILQDSQSLEAETLAAGAEGEGAQEGSQEGDDTPVEELKDIKSFLTPEELELEMRKIRPPSDADHYSIPVVLNGQVLTFIEAFKGRLRKAFVGGYQRMGRYEEMIRRTLREEGLPEDLIYMAFIESTFKPNAYSRARAKGIWQFMASTGRRYGLVRNSYVDERSDPEKATRAAARYIKDLYAMFGDWYLVMAAYNAGEGVPLRAMDRTGKRDFWDLARTRYLRAETKNFVPSILALSIMSRDPARYGFEGLEKEPPWEFDRVTVEGPTDLALVARLAGSTVQEIRALNPQITRSITPPGLRSYEIRVPRGSGESFQAAYAALPAAEKIASVRTRYRVRKGDTLAGIARRFGTSASALAGANGLQAESRLAAGMTLMVPGLYDAPGASRGRARSASRTAGPDGRYVIQSGDTLSAIARRHGTTVGDLTALNGISERTILRPGQTLLVRPKPSEGAPEARVASAKAGPPQQASIGGLFAAEAASSQKLSYTVKRGDNLYRIARKYGTTVESLQQWNGLGRASRIHPGDVLTIYQR